MITIIHGDDIVASRKKLTTLRDGAGGVEVFRFEGDSTNVTDIIQVFEAQALFGEKKLIVLEKFIETKNKELITSILNHIRKSLIHDVIFWEAKEIKKELLSLFPKQASLFFFKQEQLLFQFLDSIRPGNAKQMIGLFHKVLQRENPELVFYMLVRQFRLLLATTFGSSITETKRLAPWQRSKFERQAGLFSKDQLVNFYKKLFQLEREVKTGQNALPLASSVDLFLASI